MTCCSAARRMQPPNQLHRSCVHKLHGSKVMPEPIDTRHCSSPGDVMLCDEGCKVDAKIAPGLWAPHRDRHCFDTSRCIKHERFLAWDFPARAGLPAHLAPSKCAGKLPEPVDTRCQSVGMHNVIWCFRSSNTHRDTATTSLKSKRGEDPRLAWNIHSGTTHTHTGTQALSARLATMKCCSAAQNIPHWQRQMLHAAVADSWLQAPHRNMESNAAHFISIKGPGSATRAAEVMPK